MSRRPRTPAREPFLFDGLVFYSDGGASALKAGRVGAVNLTVAPFEGDFQAACDGVAAWLARAGEPGTPWHVVREDADFDRARTAGRIGLVMGFQNMRPIEDRLERLDLFHAAGVRIMQLTYNYRTMLGDGCLEPADGGLSRLGREAIARMNRIGIALDLSHVGERTSMQALEASSQPVLVTHANARSHFPALRNKSDALLSAVAASGGIVGVSIYGPMCWDGDPRHRPDLAGFLGNLEHVAGLVGPEHVAIGTDLPDVADLAEVAPIIDMTLKRFPAAIARYAEAFGNDVRTRYLADCASHAELWRIPEALARAGWSEARIAGLLGGNLRRVLARIWAAGRPAGAGRAGGPAAALDEARRRP